uniref:Uncharacterized protein n=1 Tax=Neogobius melanostomus TaxID=47308 RepID=A0A8C6UGR8_9GOBI
MSVSMSRSDGVTVLSLTSDPSSPCPPLCQLLGALCYSPGLCSVSRRLPSQRGGPQAVLGALWILTAILHLGLGLILTTTRGVSVFMLRITFCPVWLGVLFLFFGVVCILTERFSRPVLALLCGLLNLTGFALSIVGIVYYAQGGPGFWNYCGTERNQYYEWGYTRPPTTVSPERSALQERCEEARDLLRGLTLSLRVGLIILCVLDLCLGLSGAAFSFKALREGFRESKGKLEEEKNSIQEEKE